MNSNYIILGAFIGLFVLVALVNGAHAAECTDLIGCDSSNNGDWSGDAKLNEIGNPQAAQSQASSAKIPELSRIKRWNKSGYGFADETNKTQANSASDPVSKSVPKENTATNAAKDIADPQRSAESRKMLASMDDISSSDILVDVSENSSNHIKSSVVLPYTELDIMPGLTKSPSEIAQILGDAGISRESSVVLYGECLPCGGGPSLATYVYWIMKSMGHENVKVLDGNVEDWAAAGRETTSEAAILSSKVYEPKVNPTFSATYDYVKNLSDKIVKNGSVQIIDARTTGEYGASNIPGSINMPYDLVLNNRTIKSETDLKKVFAVLSKDKPLVVYTNSGVKASVVWFALEMMGYNAKLYSWQDWYDHQPQPVQQGNATKAAS